MKKDARLLLNARRNPIDARKILNSKLGNKTRSPRTSAVHRPLSNIRRTFPSTNNKAPQKDVKIARDGNIVITARSKTPASIRGSASANFNRPKVEKRVVPRWTPIDVDSADLEHVGIGDVLDMDSLPAATLPSSYNQALRMPPRSLAEELVHKRFTMVADQISSPQAQPVHVCVSNLHASVSKQDILELFGDVGLIKRTDMLQPGFATVEYYNSVDAHKACDLYHNRLLDGQPMQCFIQQTTIHRPSLSQRLGEQIPVHAPPTATTSSRSMAMHNPRNVRFTVKLA